MSYTHLARMAIYQYHRSQDVGDALRKLESYAVSYSRTDRDRLDIAEDRVLRYVAWLDEAKPFVFRARLNVRLPLAAGLFVGGEISRVDLEPSGGYRALLIEDKDVDVRNELRFPLLQLAVAQRMNREPSDVAVGVQMIDHWTDIRVATFGDPVLQAAEQELNVIAATIERVRGSG